MGCHPPPSILGSAAPPTPSLALASHPVLRFSKWDSWATPGVHGVGATDDASGETCDVALKCQFHLQIWGECLSCESQIVYNRVECEARRSLEMKLEFS